MSEKEKLEDLPEIITLAVGRSVILSNSFRLETHTPAPLHTLTLRNFKGTTRWVISFKSVEVLDKAFDLVLLLDRGEPKEYWNFMVLDEVLDYLSQHNITNADINWKSYFPGVW